MTLHTENLYKLQKKDIPKAGSVLADAFQYDPVWEKVLKHANFNQTCMFFQSAVRYCLQYGEVYASSELMEGVASWISGHLADMTIWRSIRSGSFFYLLKMGMKMNGMVMKMKTIFEPLEKARKLNMKDRNYIYLLIIGVSSEYQGQGHGSKILCALIEQSEKAGLPIYLETATSKNIKMYEKFNFRTLNRIDHPIINVPQWAMIREPI